MKSIIKHIFNNLLEKKFRTTIVLLTVLLSTLVIFIGLSLNEIINNTYTTMIKGAYGDSNIVITKTGDDSLYEPLDLELEETSVESRVDMISASGDTTVKEDEDISVSIIGMDIEEGKQMGLLDIAQPAENFQLSGDMSIISLKMASEYGLSLGDMVNVTIGENTYDYEIGAISENEGVFFSEIDSMNLVVTPKQVNDIYETEDRVNTSYLTVPENNINHAVQSLEEQNPDFLVQNQSIASDSRDEETFMITMMLAIVTIVLISAYIISSLSKMIVVERMPVVGTFRSLGASKRQINRILILEFLFYGIIGSSFGLIIGFFLLPMIADVFNEYRELGVETEVSYNSAYILIAFLFGAIFPALISVMQFGKVNKRSLKDIILNTQHTPANRSMWLSISGFLLILAAMVLFYLNQTDDLIISLVSVLLLFISIVLLMPLFLNLLSKGLGTLFSFTSKGEILLGIKNTGNNKMAANNSNMIIVVFILLMMVGTVTSGIDQYLNQSLTQDYDVAVSNMQENPAHYEDIQNLAGVSDTYVQYLSLAQASINGNADGFSVLGIDEIDAFDSFFSGITFIGDAKEQLKTTSNGVVLDEYQIDRFGLNVGDTIQLMALDSQSQPLEGEDSYVEAVVSGAMESSGYAQNRSTVLVHSDYFNNHFEGTLNQISIKAADDADANAVKDTIIQHYPDTDLSVLTFDEILESQKSTIDTLINGITVIVLLGLLLGVLGISNNLLVSFMQRKKEFSVLYSVCMSRGQIVKVLLVEMFMTFLVVVIVGLSGSLAMNVVMTKLLYSIGLRVNFQFDYELFVILSGVVLVLLILSTTSIIRKVYKMNIVQNLRLE